MGAALNLSRGVEFPNEEKRRASALNSPRICLLTTGGSCPAGIIGGDQGVEDTGYEARSLLSSVR
jgi:hypothetical protein